MIRLLAALALVGGTVYTGDGAPIPNATVLIEANRVQAVGADVAVPAGASVVDVTGSIVTPGLIDPLSRLGVQEVDQVPSSVEATLPESWDWIRASLRVADTYDPQALTLPVARANGITSAVIAPRGGLVQGLSVWADLTPENPLREEALALHVRMTARSERGSRAQAFLRLREVLADAHLYRDNRGPFISRRLRELSVSAEDLEVISRALAGELPVVFWVDRAASIETVLEIAREHALRTILAGAAEGWMVAAEIAAADVPVLLDPMRNLPRSFDALHSRANNALILRRAGVRVAFTQLGESHLAGRLRQVAGNAVASGYPYDDAIAAITSVPAEVFGVIDAGTLRPGSLANVVVWNGDPLELTSWPTRIWIRGNEVDLTTRQDLLTERYK